MLPCLIIPRYVTTVKFKYSYVNNLDSHQLCNNTKFRFISFKKKKELVHLWQMHLSSFPVLRKVFESGNVRMK